MNRLTFWVSRRRFSELNLGLNNLHMYRTLYQASMYKTFVCGSKNKLDFRLDLIKDEEANPKDKANNI